MANLRKLIASALSGADLSQDPLCETAIDRIGAMAFSNRLGGELWRMKEGNDAAAAARALALLVKRVRKAHDSKRWYRRLCLVALREWMDRACRGCGGRGLIQATVMSAQHTCTVCNGSGQRSYSDQWRMNQLGLSKESYGKWERRLALIHEQISAADRAEYATLALQLERIAPLTRKKVLDFRRGRDTLARSSRDDPAQTDNYMLETIVSSSAGAD